MTILYWITVLGNLYTLGRVLLIILLAVTCSIICGIGIYTLVNFPIIKQDEIRIKKAFNIVKKSLLYSILPLLIVIVVPSTKQLYAIYGVGTVIDYAKNSKAGQKLPDNAVKALNVWLENVNRDKKDSINNN